MGGSRGSLAEVRRRANGVRGDCGIVERTVDALGADPVFRIGRSQLHNII